MTPKTKLLAASSAIFFSNACAQVPDTVAQSAVSPIERVDAFYAALAAEDQDAALGMLAPDAMLHAPYNPNGDATDAGIRSFPASMYVAGAMQTYDNLVFEDREYSVADDGGTVWIEAEGRLRVAATGKHYENRYVFKIELDDGKIVEITEYTNVATLARDGVTAGAQ
ncbi:MAG: nuclear transport factor 2 family protein [Pseudomonadota bacterium]